MQRSPSAACARLLAAVFAFVVLPSDCNQVLLPRKHLQGQEVGRQPPENLFDVQKHSSPFTAARSSSQAYDSPPGPGFSFSDFAEIASAGVPRYELVIARLNEDVKWLTQIPAFWNLTIYNKGGPSNPVQPVPGRVVTVIDIPNQGREAETYMHHIVLRWNTLADYTVFGQAWPFVHSKHYVELLNNPQLLGPVQCMSLVYIAQGHPHNVTPREVVEAHRKHPWYRSERLSLRTLDSIYFNDVGANQIAQRYLALHSLPPGSNIIAHHFDIIGLKGWVPHEQEIGSFAYGGLFGVHRDKIKQHPRDVYENFMASLIASDLHAWIAERMYLMLFGGRHFADI